MAVVLRRRAPLQGNEQQENAAEVWRDSVGASAMAIASECGEGSGALDFDRDDECCWCGLPLAGKVLLSGSTCVKTRW
jgi:hypothetical protein